jgi:polysaccharide biosynthesis/export protein
MKKTFFQQAEAVAGGRKFKSLRGIWAIAMAVTFLAGCSTQQPSKAPQTMPAPPAGAFPLVLNGASKSSAVTPPTLAEIPSSNSPAQQFPALPPPVAAPTWPGTPGNPPPVQLPGIASGPQGIGAIPSGPQSMGSIPSGPQSTGSVASQGLPPKAVQLPPPSGGSQTLSIQPAAYRPPQYHLNVGDQLDISVFRADASKDDDMRRTVLIGPDGTISYFFVSGMQAAGLSLPELQNQLTERLSQYIRSPGVAVILAQPPQKRVYVVGQVVEQGVRQLDTNHGDTLEDAIFSSKGLTPQANVDQAYVIRKDVIIGVNLGHLLFSGDETQNVVLQTGDVVYVPEVVQQEVFVLGYVEKATPVAVSRPITVTEAIAAAQGFRVGAQKSDVQVIHGGLGTGAQHSVETVDMDAVLAGKGGDTLVQRGDIVYVPSTILGSWNEVVAQLTPSLMAMFEAMFISAGMP